MAVANKSPPKDAALWLTRTDAAALCGLSTRSFDESVRPRLDKGASRGKAASLRYHGPAVVAALVAYRVEQARPTDPGDPVMSGPNSPALERCRTATAVKLERANDVDAGTLVPADEIRRALAAGFAALRGVGEKLKARFGNDARDLYDLGLDDFLAAARGARFGPGGPDESGPDAAAEDD